MPVMLVLDQGEPVLREEVLSFLSAVRSSRNAPHAASELAKRSLMADRVLPWLFGLCYPPLDDGKAACPLDRERWGSAQCHASCGVQGPDEPDLRIVLPLLSMPSEGVLEALEDICACLYNEDRTRTPWGYKSAAAQKRLLPTAVATRDDSAGMESLAQQAASQLRGRGVIHLTGVVPAGDVTKLLADLQAWRGEESGRITAL